MTRNPATHDMHMAINDVSLTVTWPDSHVGKFDLFWLRDNCSCSTCGDRSVGQKRVSMLNMPADPRIVEAHCDDGSDIRVTWSDDRHQSVYPTQWLRQHCYCELCRENRSARPQLWDSGLQDNLPTFDFDAVTGTDCTRLDFLSDIVSTGFSLVRGVPVGHTGFETLLDSIGYVKETNYGRICDLKVNSSGKLIGDTNLPIPLHTDECYRHANPGMLAFHCVSTSEDGGGVNLLADGFTLAGMLRDENPEAFNLLCQVPMVSRRFHADEVDLRSASPIISVDWEGNLQGIRYNERSAAPLDVPAHLVKAVYSALNAWLKLTRDPKLQVRIQMTPGDAIVFDNQRVLHGRDTFNGSRHLLYAQLDLDEPHSRNRVLARRLDDGAVPGYTHRGT